MLDRASAYRILLVSLVGLGVGAVAAVAAIAFVDAVLWLNELLLVSAYARVQHDARPWLVTAATVLVPSLGGVVIGLICSAGCASAARWARPTPF